MKTWPWGLGAFTGQVRATYGSPRPTPTLHASGSPRLERDIRKACVLAVRLQMNTFRLPCGVFCSLRSRLGGPCRTGPCVLPVHGGSPGVRTGATALLTAKSSLVTVPPAPRTRGGRHGPCAPCPPVLSHPDELQPRHLEGCGHGWDILSSRCPKCHAGLAVPRGVGGGKKLGELISFMYKDEYFGAPGWLSH